MDATLPYPDMQKVLAELKSMGKSLAVVSNKPDNLSNDSLVKFFFPDIIFAFIERRVARYPSQTGSRKHFIALSLPYNLALSDTIYIGDSDVDMQFAHNAKSHCRRCLLGLSRQRNEKNGRQYSPGKILTILPEVVKTSISLIFHPDKFRLRLQII